MNYRTVDADIYLQNNKKIFELTLTFRGSPHNDLEVGDRLCCRRCIARRIGAYLHTRNWFQKNSCVYSVNHRFMDRINLADMP